MRLYLAAFALVLTIIIAGIGLGDPNLDPPQRRSNLLELNDGQVAHLSPVLREVRTAYLAQIVARAVLADELAKATDAQHIHQLERQIADLGTANEANILEIQAKHLRSAGRIAEAEILAANAADLLAPQKRQAVPSIPRRKAVQK